MKRWFHDRGLSFALGALFLASWALQFIFQVTEVTLEAATHGEAFQWSDLWVQFGRATFENWQSEFLQLLTFVVLSKFLIHRDSPQSRDGDDEMKAQLDRIESAVTGTEIKSQADDQ